MTPFVEVARQLVRGLDWCDGAPNYFVHNGQSLKWRHHGLGMLQAEFSEELRMHIWHPKLVSPGMAWPRCVHDHRFDITSAVVVGEILDVPCVARLDQETCGTWAEARVADWERVGIYVIKHAKNQDRMVDQKGCSTATSAICLGLGRLQANVTQHYATGSDYRIERRQFHTTRVERLTITIVHRSNFDDQLARVLCAPDKDVTAISGIVRDESIEHRILVDWVLRGAAGAIADMR